MTKPAIDFGVRYARIPKWMTEGIKIEPYVDDALESITTEMERRQGRGIGARRNTIRTDRRSAMQHSVRTSLRGGDPAESIGRHPRFNPRVSGRSWRDKQTSRFRGMAPRVVKKYIIEPLRARWAA